MPSQSDSDQSDAEAPGDATRLKPEDLLSRDEDGAHPSGPIDAEFQPAYDASPSSTGRRGKGVGLPLVLGLSVAAALLGGWIGIVWDRAPAPIDARVSIAAVEGLEERLAEGEAVFSTLQSRVVEAEQALAARPEAPGPDSAIADLTATVERLEQTITEVSERAAQPQPAPDETAIAALGEQITALQNQVSALTQRLDALETAPSASVREDPLSPNRTLSAAALGAAAPASTPNTTRLAQIPPLTAEAQDALDALIDAARGAEGYAEALQAFQAKAPADALEGELATLSAHAQTGAPLIADLMARFDVLASEYGVAPLESAEPGLASRLGTALARSVTLRRSVEDAVAETPEADIQARFARAQAALEAPSTDLRAAADALAPLGGDAPAVAAWVTNARARADVEAALARLAMLASEP